MSHHLLSRLLMLLLVGMLAACGGQPPERPKAVKQFSDSQACVEPIAEMRKNHMKYILHQRDKTVHEGIRTREHSFEECINCHVAPKSDGSYPAANTTEHFCSSCHLYSAVKIDCFQCHNDNPVRPSQLTANEGDIQFAQESFHHSDLQTNGKL